MMNINKCCDTYFSILVLLFEQNKKDVKEVCMIYGTEGTNIKKHALDIEMLQKNSEGADMENVIFFHQAF